MKFLYYTVFLFVSLYILLKAIGYGIYEIKEEKNQSGGICVICFSILIVIFSNLVLWIR